VAARKAWAKQTELQEAVAAIESAAATSVQQGLFHEEQQYGECQANAFNNALQNKVLTATNIESTRAAARFKKHGDRRGSKKNFWPLRTVHLALVSLGGSVSRIHVPCDGRDLPRFLRVLSTDAMRAKRLVVYLTYELRYHKAMELLDNIEEAKHAVAIIDGWVIDGEMPTPVPVHEYPHMMFAREVYEVTHPRAGCKPDNETKAVTSKAKGRKAAAQGKLRTVL
jgi:hypothetical protein